MDTESSPYERFSDFIGLTLLKKFHWMDNTFQHTCDQNDNS